MRQKGFIELLFLVFVVLIGFLGFHYFKVASRNKIELPVVAPSVSPAISPTLFPKSKTQEIKNGVLYANLAAKYEVAVPSDWKIEEDFSQSSQEIVFVPPSSQNKQVYRTVLSIISTKNEKIKYDLDTEEKYQEWIKKPATGGQGKRFYKVRNVNVDGNIGVKFIKKALPGDPAEAYYGVITWIRRDGKNYYMELGGDELRSWEVMGTYNKALFSFKFTD